MRWGVMGTGAVAEDFSRVLLALPTAQLAAVGSRSEQKAQSFLRKVGAGEVGAVAHGSYESLLADENVDIVYVATPSARHVSGACTPPTSQKPIALTWWSEAVSLASC